MCRRLIGIGLLVAAIIAVPGVDVYAQKKKAEDNAKEQPDAIDSSKLRSGEFVGVLRSVPGPDRKFNLEIQVPQATAGGGGYGGNNVAGRVMQMQMQMRQAQMQIATARNPQQQQQAMQRMRQAQMQMLQAVAQAQRGGGGGGRVNMAKMEIEFQAAESVKVRTMVISEQFDAKGNPKKFTREELAAMKGKERTLPGYESSLEKLESGAPVRLVLAAAPVKPGDKDENDKRMQVRMIVVLGEATAMAGQSREKKKEK